MRNLRSRPLLWLTAAALLMVTIDLGRGVLSTNDEVRFAVLGQDILAGGSWIFPQLNGDQPRLTVLLQDRLASRPISVVGYAPGP
ncbi:MAG TPA: hypothetical protein VGR44_09020 [Methylomirabilota bacterium]|jgi:4-amino-4-deoxy-L-arabinose transferase-like glycosyltransferase|nr:hypothetical protein [Methylomirabilota bacterium]